MIKFLWLARRAYLQAQKHGSYYCAITNHGVPEICLFVGIGREAWRITQRAAWRDTDPRSLWYADRQGIDIIGGPPNFVLSLQKYCTRFGVSQIIAAWGKPPHGNHRQLLFKAANWKLDCFEKNADGSPHHPLYLPYTLIPKPWNYEKEKNVSA